MQIIWVSPFFKARNQQLNGDNGQHCTYPVTVYGVLTTWTTLAVILVSNCFASGEFSKSCPSSLWLTVSWSDEDDGVLANVAPPPHPCWPMWHHHHMSVSQCTPPPHACWPMWHHQHICVGQCGTTTTCLVVNVYHHNTRVGQCGTTTTCLLVNVAPPPHACWPMWHHQHICVGLCGTTTTSVLANVAPPLHRCWPIWHHHYIGVGQCGTTTTSVLA